MYEDFQKYAFLDSGSWRGWERRCSTRHSPASFQVPIGSTRTMVSSDDSPNEDVKRTFSRWLFGQEANTVALFLILGAFAWTCYYLLTTGIPSHLRMIHSGYESINLENNKARDEDRKARSEDRQAFEKTLDRYERVFKQHADKSD